MNKQMVIGYLGRDAEFKYIANGQGLCKFSVATTETFKKRDEKVQETEWHEVTLWGKLAEAIHQYLKKGTLIYVEGKTKTESWEGKDGTKKTRKVIIAEHVQMLGKSHRQDEDQSHEEHSDNREPGSDEASDEMPW